MKLNYVVSDKIDKVVATDFVQKYHYSPVMPRLTKYILGFYIDGVLKGVLTLGWGTRPRHTFNKLFPTLGILEKNKNKEWIEDINDWYYEIGKMCLSPDLNNTKGAGSQMVSATIRWMKDNTKCQFLYTMADGIMGKCGFVYQASNFYYGEKFKTNVYMMENGEKFHPRSSSGMCKENADFLIKKHGKDFLLKYKPTPRTGNRQPRYFTTDFMLERGIKRLDGLMFRYLYPLNKKAKKLMLRDSSLAWGKKYPKEKDLKWNDITDMKKKKDIPQPAFKLDKIQYNLKNTTAHQRSKKIKDVINKARLYYKKIIAKKQKDVVTTIEDFFK
tara:strand:+ start:1727 stop:2713 length:987 start_codon:yes stop_codon:yes gene_type:complete